MTRLSSRAERRRLSGVLMVLVDIRRQTPGRGSCAALSKITGTSDQQGQVPDGELADPVPRSSACDCSRVAPRKGEGRRRERVPIEGGSGTTGYRSVLCSGKFTLEDRVTVDAGGTEAERGLARTAAQTFRAGKPESARF